MSAGSSVEATAAVWRPETQLGDLLFAHKRSVFQEGLALLQERGNDLDASEVVELLSRSLEGGVLPHRLVWRALDRMWRGFLQTAPLEDTQKVLSTMLGPVLKKMNPRMQFPCPLPRWEGTQILRILCAWLEFALPQLEQAQQRKFMSWVGGVFAALPVTDRSPGSLAWSIVGGLLQKHPEVTHLVLSLLGDALRVAREMLPILQVVLSWMERPVIGVRFRDAVSQGQDALRSLFEKVIVGASKDGMLPEDLKPFYPWLASAEPEFIGTHLLPILVRACKKSPSSTVAFLPAFFQPLKQPLGEFLLPASKDTVMSLILGFCQNDNEKVRVPAVECFLLLKNCVDSVDVLGHILQTVCSAIKGGKLTAPVSRESFFRCVESLASSACLSCLDAGDRAAVSASLAAEVFETLSQFAMEEGNVAAHQAVGEALASWIVCSQSIPPFYLSMLSGVIERGERIEAGHFFAHLHPLYQSLRGCEQLREEFKSALFSQLFDFVKSVSGKHMLEGHLVLALSALLASLTSADELQSSGLLAVLFSGKKGLASLVKGVSSISDERILLQCVCLVEAIFDMSPAWLKSQPHDNLLRLAFLLCSWSTSWKVRVAARDAMVRLLSKPDLEQERAVVLLAMMEFLSELSLSIPVAGFRELNTPKRRPSLHPCLRGPEAVLLAPHDGPLNEGSSSGTSDSVDPSTVRYFSSIIFSLLPLPLECASETAGPLLLLVNMEFLKLSFLPKELPFHPEISRGSRFHTLHRFRYGAFRELPVLLLRDLEAFSQFLLSPKALFHKSLFVRRAATLAFTSLCQVGGSAVLRSCMGPLEGYLSSLAEQDDAVTFDEANIFFKQPGTLYQQVSLADVTDETEGMQQKGKGGNRGKQSDQEWEDQLRREMARKKGKSPEQRLEELRARIAEEEDQVCLRLGELQNAMSSILQTIACASVDVSDIIIPHLPPFVDRMVKMMKSPLMHEMSAWSFRYLASSQVSSPQWILDATARCLRRLVGDRLDGSRSSDDSDIDFLAFILNAMVEEGDMELGPFVIAFPLLERVLHANWGVVYHQQALECLSWQVETPNFPFLKSATIALYRTLQKGAPNLHPKAQSCLLQLSKQTVATMSSLEPHLEQLLNPIERLRLCAATNLLHINGLEAVNEEDTSGVSNPMKSPVHYLHMRLFLATCDVSPAVSAVATQVWHCYQRELTPEYFEPLCDFVYTRPEEVIRNMIGNAFMHGMLRYPESASSTLSRLFALYKSLAITKEEMVTQYLHDKHVEERKGIAVALGKVAGALSPPNLPVVFSFLIHDALLDVDEGVRESMVEAGLEQIKVHGRNHVGLLLPLFEKYLENPGNGDRDFVVTSVIIFMGHVARHLEDSDPKVYKILEHIMEALKTPSEAVQSQIAECMAPLMRADSVRPHHHKLVEGFLRTMRNTDSFPLRRGSCFGLAGCIKGMGFMSIKHLDLIDSLESMLKDRSVTCREAGVMAVECLSTTLGQLFEPFFVRLMPAILTVMGDNSSDVRDACEETVRVLMANLSVHGVKEILPILLKGLDERHWRTKAGAVDMLGRMAYCAPRQLSACLPTIVPPLALRAKDSHPDVANTAKQALERVGGVVANPEIQSHIHTLIEAICDPANRTKIALEHLLGIRFVHTIDAPSLALIMPLLVRGLRERSTDTKKKAAKIVGSMSSLITTPQDMLPYIDQLLEPLKMSLVDPIPEVRAISARALGELVKGLGESAFPSLLDHLRESLQRENTTSSERAGCAQGLCEVAVAVGVSRLEMLLPEVLENVKHPVATVRDAFFQVVAYLPLVLREKFLEFLPRVLPTVLLGLSDEADHVRHTALKAGQVIVDAHGKSSFMTIIPHLEKSLLDINWRIRLAACQLLGDLLSKQLDLKNKSVEFEDMGELLEERAKHQDDFGKLARLLGQERLHLLLSTLYMLSSDLQEEVVEAATKVWRLLVDNSPRMIRQILPVLTKLLVSSLAMSPDVLYNMETAAVDTRDSDSEDGDYGSEPSVSVVVGENGQLVVVGGASASEERTRMAASTIAELVNKMPDQIIPDLVPVLVQAAGSQDSKTRQGACLGLAEVVRNGRRYVSNAIKDIVPVVRSALCDVDPAVQAAGAELFSGLQRAVGSRIMDEILQFLLDEVSEGSDEAVRALEELLKSHRGRSVLSFLLPRLLALKEGSVDVLPVQQVGAMALVASSAPDAFVEGISQVFPLLLSTLVDAEVQGTPEDVQSLETSVQRILDSFGENGVLAVLKEVDSALNHNKIPYRLWSANILLWVVSSPQIPLEDVLDSLMTVLCKGLNDRADEVMERCIDVLESVTNKVSKDFLAENLYIIRDALHSQCFTRDPVRKILTHSVLRAFESKRGLALVIPAYSAAVIKGSYDSRTEAIYSISELLEICSTEPLVDRCGFQLAGPLLRIFKEKFDEDTKEEILRLLCQLVERCGVALKACVPQLHGTFLRALLESPKVSSTAADCLGSMVEALPLKVDTLLRDLSKSLTEHAEDAHISKISLEALDGVILRGGTHVPPDMLVSVWDNASNFLTHSSDKVRASAAKAISSAAILLGEEHLGSLLRTHIFSVDQNSDEVTLFNAGIFIGEIFYKKADALMSQPGWLDSVEALIIVLGTHRKVPVRLSGIQGGKTIMSAALEHCKPTDSAASSDILLCCERTIAPLMADIIRQDDDNDLRRFAALMIKNVAKEAQRKGRTVPGMSSLIPILFASQQDRCMPVKLMTQRALFHTLQLDAGFSILDTYLEHVSSEQTKIQIKTFCERQLAREDLNVDSDD